MTMFVRIVRSRFSAFFRRSIFPSPARKHLSPQRQTLLTEKANKLRLSAWWRSNIKPFMYSLWFDECYLHRFHNGIATDDTTPRRIIPNLVASCHCTGSGISFGKWDFCCSSNVCFSRDDNLKNYFGFSVKTSQWHRHDYNDHKFNITMMMKIEWKARTMMISRTILDPQWHRFIFYTLWRNLMFMAPLARQH